MWFLPGVDVGAIVATTFMLRWSGTNIRSGAVTNSKGRAVSARYKQVNRMEN
ncbi:hypothetical protein P3T40_004632 [Paraburkholderia sp. EB58]|jgi:hypothetical protein